MGFGRNGAGNGACGDEQWRCWDISRKNDHSFKGVFPPSSSSLLVMQGPRIFSHSSAWAKINLEELKIGQKPIQVLQHSEYESHTGTVF